MSLQLNASSPPPPPPLPAPPPPTQIVAQKHSAAMPGQPFTSKGTTKDNTVFEFSEPDGAPRSVTIRSIVRQYLASPRLSSARASEMYMILGRLRSLHCAVIQYNQGVTAPTRLFLQYWRHRTLNLLSGFGFQISSSQEKITIAGLGELIQTLEKIYAEEINAARDTINNGLITFEALGELYRPNTLVQGPTGLHATTAAFLVVESYYQERRALTGTDKSFHVQFEYIVSLGDHFSLVSFTQGIYGWAGVRPRPLSSLSYAPTDQSGRASFQTRGQSYLQFATGGAKFLAYSPYTFYPHISTSHKVRSDLTHSTNNMLPSGGRLMVDVARGAPLGHHACQGVDEPTLAMVSLAERYGRSRNALKQQTDEALVLWDDVPDELAMFCWPALIGFSFTAKAWGHVLIEGLSPIMFRDDAFDRLVLAEERKQLIRALVNCDNKNSPDDLVVGKGGGTIFLLHGTPGVGKTLTAEAIAEVLHRPLYYVTIGELGTSPDSMERRLSDIFELCEEWNAITILDEADVFLEQRTTNDLVRNAMVCVMLRLLEYHRGILFLTTNRVRRFDPAFESRVTIALRYKPLDSIARNSIWQSLLDRASIPLADDISLPQLRQHVLNGRQIKNAIRLAVALAKEQQSVSLTQEILERTLSVISVGRKEMMIDDSRESSSDETE